MDSINGQPRRHLPRWFEYTAIVNDSDQNVISLISTPWLDMDDHAFGDIPKSQHSADDHASLLTSTKPLVPALV